MCVRVCRGSRACANQEGVVFGRKRADLELVWGGYVLYDTNTANYNDAEVAKAKRRWRTLSKSQSRRNASWRKPTTDFSRSLRLAPQCGAFSSLAIFSAYFMNRCPYSACLLREKHCTDVYIHWLVLIGAGIYSLIGAGLLLLWWNQITTYYNELIIYYVMSLSEPHILHCVCMYIWFNCNNVRIYFE